MRQQVMPTRSYLSQVEPVITFGLGNNHQQVMKAEIHWPSGINQVVDIKEVDRSYKIVEP